MSAFWFWFIKPFAEIAASVAMILLIALIYIIFFGRK